MSALLENLNACPILNRMGREEQEEIAPFLVEHAYDDGVIVLQQGQTSGIFHIIVEGKADVYLEQSPRVRVAGLSPGQFFGEMSCLTGEAVSATVQAAGLLRTLSMSREGLLRLLDRSSYFRSALFDAMIKRVGSSNERVAEERTRSNVILRQMQQEQQARYGLLVGSGPFIARLRGEIAEAARKPYPVTIIGEPGTGKTHVARELHEASGRSPYPLLELDCSNFHMDDYELKLRAAQSGTMLLKRADKLPADLLRSLLEQRSETRIVMTAELPLAVQSFDIHMIPLRERAEDIPQLVAEFLKGVGGEEAITGEALRMVQLFPFLRDNVRELRRIVEEAIVLSGGKPIRPGHLRFNGPRVPGARPKIGLALGSGSVRGAAHVGVLKVLEEANIPVDLIAGSSVGAFIGALYAGGQPISAFERVLPTVRWRQLTQFAWSKAGLLDNRRLMSRFVEKYIGPVDFADLRIPFAAVASDAITGDAYVFNKGRVSHAICASTAIPGIMCPVKSGERLLADGGVAHSVPAALVRGMGADIVIAVNVSIPPYKKRASRSVITALLNTIELLSDRMTQDELHLADIVLQPSFASNQMTFKASPGYIHAGEEAARASMADIRARIDRWISG